MKGKKLPRSISINMSGQEWAAIGRLCEKLNLNQYDYASTTHKKAGLLIFHLTRCVVSGTELYPIPKPEDYI